MTCWFICILIHFLAWFHFQIDSSKRLYNLKSFYILKCLVFVFFVCECCACLEYIKYFSPEHPLDIDFFFLYFNVVLEKSGFKMIIICVLSLQHIPVYVSFSGVLSLTSLTYCKLSNHITKICFAAIAPFMLSILFILIVLLGISPIWFSLYICSSSFQCFNFGKILPGVSLFF